jgi:hypothetical protein
MVAAGRGGMDHTNMRSHRKGNPLWQWWWPLGGVALAVLVAGGVATAWSGALWAVAAVVAAVYLGIPMLATSLKDLTGTADPAASGGENNPPSLAPPSPPMPQPLIPGPTLETVAAEVRQSRETLQVRIADHAMRSGGRPWRRVGSAQFAELVYALAASVPSVDEAISAATLAGVSRQLIRSGRDNPIQRWQAVLEQAIDDGADDSLCSAALNLTNSARLRSAVAEWIGIQWT